MTSMFLIFSETDGYLKKNIHVLAYFNKWAGKNSIRSIRPNKNKIKKLNVYSDSTMKY